MADVVTPEVRSRMMSGIRSAHTRPELLLRKGLHARGFRFRLHSRHLPGKPDLVFSRYRAVLFAHGCFWHGHDCNLFKMPSTRPDFWRAKIMRNATVDHRTNALLSEMNWRVGVVWECAIKGPGKLDKHLVIKRCAEWLESKKLRLEIRGTK